MRNFLSLYLLNVGLALATVAVALLVYLYFPSDGFSAGPILAVVAAVILIVLATWALWPPNYNVWHVIAGMVCGLTSVGVIALAVNNNGWGTIATTSGLVLLVLAWIGVATILNHRVADGTWPW